VYPNLLNIVLAYMRTELGPGGTVDARTLTPLELFSAFYEDMTEEDLDEERKKVLVSIIEKVELQHREVGT
jgi:hypothetical protein